MSMAIFAWNNINGYSKGGIINNKGLARQSPCSKGSQLFNSVLTGFDTVAVQQFDPQAWDQGRLSSSKILNQRMCLIGSVFHQLCRGSWLNPIEFVIQRSDGYANVLAGRLKRAMNRWMMATDDLAHKN